MLVIGLHMNRLRPSLRQHMGVDSQTQTVQLSSFRNFSQIPQANFERQNFSFRSNWSLSSPQPQAQIQASGTIQDSVPCSQGQPVMPLHDTVNVTTGEEKEECLLSAEAKIFQLTMANGKGYSGWQSRGHGVLHLNHCNTTGNSRVLMRSHQVLRVILNIPLFAGMHNPQLVGQGSRGVMLSTLDQQQQPQHHLLQFDTMEIAQAMQRQIQRLILLLADPPLG